MPRRFGSYGRRCARSGTPAQGSSGPEGASGYQTFSASNYWSSVSSGNTAGDATMTFAVVFRVDAAASGTQFLMSGGSFLYDLYQTGAGTFIARFLDGTSRKSSSAAFTLGKTNTFLATVTGGVLTPYVNGTAGTTVATDGSYGGSGNQQLFLGAGTGGAAAATSHTVMGGYVASGYAMDASEVSSWHSACVAANDVVDPGVSAEDEELFSFRDGKNNPASFAGRINSTTCNKQGTGGTYVEFTPDWGT